VVAWLGSVVAFVGPCPRGARLLLAGLHHHPCRKTIPQRDSTLADGPFFCQDGVMARKKTTVYIDDELLRAAKVAAARSGKREYEVFEDALRQHLGLAGAIERIWAGISPQDAPSEQEAARIAAEELAAVRAERLAHRVS